MWSSHMQELHVWQTSDFNGLLVCLNKSWRIRHFLFTVMFKMIYDSALLELFPLNVGIHSVYKLLLRRKWFVLKQKGNIHWIYSKLWALKYNAVCRKRQPKGKVFSHVKVFVTAFFPGWDTFHEMRVIISPHWLIKNIFFPPMIKKTLICIQFPKCYF